MHSEDGNNVEVHKPKMIDFWEDIVAMERIPFITVPLRP